MDYLHLVQKLREGFSLPTFVRLLRLVAPDFRQRRERLDDFLEEEGAFDDAIQLGVIALPDVRTVLVAAVHVRDELTARSSRRKQYALIKRVLKAENHNAALVAFHDDAGRFRLSLVTVTYYGTRRRFSTYRRYTFFVDPDLPNKTFIQQFRRANFSTLENIRATFSLEAVSDEFYREFRPHFDALAEETQGTADETLKQDFALLFTIRTIFLGFVQKKGWLGDNPRFLQGFWEEYRQWKRARGETGDHFYRDWLEPLFFEALKHPPGEKVAYGHAPFSEKTQQVLQMAPYLNGELFERKHRVDDEGLWIPDARIGDFFDFLFQYNFTVEENELYDEELELNPEFLGIIFERLTNMEQGAVYTPRVEVDLMCRLSLVKWLEGQSEVAPEKLYRLFFPTGDEAAHDDAGAVALSPAEIRSLIGHLERVTVCDPAAGSGAFEVGMLQVLDQTLEKLYTHRDAPADLRAQAPSPFERKRAIIARSLYGVEVKRWAVWINQLRLWLTLFVEMGDDARRSYEPLLPNLTFKVRVGDSLVQRLGEVTFPIHGYLNLPPAVKRRITALKREKRDFFYNRRGKAGEIEHEEARLFHAILDAQIEARRREQVRLRHAPTMQALAGMEAVARDAGAQLESRLAQLEAEIDALKEQKEALREDHPFIWSLEFAEVFFDRGGFDIIIGNPPYVRQESIADPYGTLDPRAYKEALLEMVRLDFPGYFARSRAQTDRFRQGRKPSGRSDLYTYFYIRSLRLLNKRGVHVFICSNSWLDVGYGAWLQAFFLHKAPLHLVIDNHARRSFARADINTVITVAGAPQRRVSPDHVVRFVAFKRPFEEVVHAETFIAIEEAAQLRRTEDFRVFPITVAALLRAGSAPAKRGRGRYVGDKWGGKYLRAPDIFFTILEKGKGKLVRLGEIAEVNEGRPTGANNFFFVPVETAREFQIERRYLLPALMKTRGKSFLEVTHRHIDRYFLALPRDKSWQKDKVSRYVEYGERTVLPKSRTLKAKKVWWYIPVRPPADLIAPCGYGDRVWCAVNSAGALTSNSYAEVRLQSREYLSSVFFTLNHPVGWMFLELLGRVSLGGGMLKVDPIEYRKLQVVRVERKLFLPFDRPVQTIFTECGIDPTSGIPIAEQEPHPLPDRQALDAIIFDALGLTAEERKEVYRAVCRLVWERLSKARSVRKCCTLGAKR